MRWSNLIKSNSDSATASVLEYKPKQFDLGTPEAALDYLVQKQKGSDFVLSDVLRATTGVEKIEQQSEVERVEQLALDKVASLQEEAYKQGFELGKDEGFKSAFEKKTSDISSGLDDIQKLVLKIQSLKQDLVLQNEAHIISLIYQIAEKIAFDHIQAHPETVIHVIRHSIEAAQAEEDVTVLVAPEQIDFIEKMKLQSGKEFEFLKTIKLQASDTVEPGGCIVETNYGVIDARVRERTEKLWEEIRQTIPKIKQKVG